MPPSSDSLTIFISTPLEDEYVDRIRSVAPERVTVRHEPELLPPTRYVADHVGDPEFRRSAENDRRFSELVSQADILWDIPPKRPDGSSVIDDADNLRWVQTTSSGVGPLVRKLRLVERGVLVTTARGIHARPLTEFVFMALLIRAKDLEHLRSEQAAHNWRWYCGDSLAGKRLSIIGLGGIGRQVAAVGKAFGMHVNALLRPGVRAAAADYGVDTVFPAAGLHDMLAETDALVLCAPHTPVTARMMNRAAFRALKPGAIFINVARGSLVDEAAMIDALDSGRLSYAALDVFDVEPLPADSPLWDMQNVLVSPHSASTVNEENRRITEIFCHNLPLFLDGRYDEMRNRFDHQRGY